MNKKGQSILSEYVMIFFVVIAAIVAMSTLVQRGLEARLHDARNFVVNSVKKVCDTNCLEATGTTIPYEYEPYYAQMLADTQHNEETNDESTTGNAVALGAVYLKLTDDETKTISTSKQLPPGCADGVKPKPPYC